MIYINETDIGGVWIHYLRSVLETGTMVYDSREDILESEQIAFRICEFSDRNEILSRFADERVTKIYTEKMFSKKIIAELNSTYGDRLFDIYGVNQVDLAVSKLRENPWSKSCFIPLVIPNDPGPRVPCLSAIQISIRHSSLQFHATFRSQNALNAYGNFMGLKALRDMIASSLCIRAGDVNVVVNFPHIYKSNIERARRIVAEVLS